MDTLITSLTIAPLMDTFVDAAAVVLPVLLGFLAFRKIKGLIKSV